MASAVMRYAPTIRAAARRYKIKPSLLAGLIQVESAGNPSAVSSAGAFGLTQFMPATARSYGVQRGTSRQAKISQIMGAARYLVEAGARKDPRRALSAYVAGPAGGRQTWYENRVLQAARQFSGLDKGGGGGGGGGVPGTKPTKIPGIKYTQMNPFGQQAPSLTEMFAAQTDTDEELNPLEQAAQSNAQLFQYLAERRMAKSEPIQEIKFPGLTIPGTKGTKGGGSTGDIVAGKAWGGSQNVINPAIALAKSQFGISPSSLKRGYNTVSGGMSDHFTGNRQAFAADLPARGNQGTKLAKALAKRYGIKGPVIGTFQRHVIKTRNGQRYSIQILWQVKDHYDHVHIGARRV